MYQRVYGATIDDRHLIVANGVPVAQYTSRSNGVNDTRYFYRDALRSITLIADEAGVVTERFSYDAHGKRRFPNGADDTGYTLSSNATDLGYTGHEQLEEIRLIHMNGRLYDPQLGRFISADPIDPRSLSSQHWNRFSYVLNNPFRYVDPTGYEGEDNGEGDDDDDPVPTTCRESGNTMICVPVPDRTDDGGMSGFIRVGLRTGPANPPPQPRVTCSGPMSFSVVGPNDVLNRVGALGIVPPDGSLAINPRLFGFAYRPGGGPGSPPYNERAAAQSAIRAEIPNIRITVSGLARNPGAINGTSRYVVVPGASTTFTIGDVGDPNILNAPYNRSDIYRNDSNNFFARNLNTTADGVPSNWTPPPGWSCTP